MLLLSQVKPGEKVRIISLAGGRGFYARLLSMGLIPGSTIEVINQGVTGPYIIAQNGCRLALGTCVAHRIIVSDPEKPNETDEREMYGKDKHAKDEGESIGSDIRNKDRRRTRTTHTRHGARGGH